LLLEALVDCQAMVTGRLGHRLTADLAAAGIEAYTCPAATVDEAADQFAVGQLARATLAERCHPR
jgi:predicted Fe-Mo cluster-binding NifX family protein